VRRIDNEQQLESRINYTVLGILGVLIVFFGFANSLTPQVDSELDFFELTFVLSQAAAAVISFMIAKRYWGSKVFGAAYLSLGIACSLYCAGLVLYLIFQIGYAVAYPYPSWPDVGLFLFYPFAIFHLARNVHYFRKNLQRIEKLLIVLMPAFVTILYVALTFLSAGDPNTTGANASDNLGIQQQHVNQFWNSLFLGAAYMVASTVLFSYALIGFRLFHKSLLGAPWGLLLVGLILTWAGDLAFFYSSIYSYDRTNPIITVWVAGSIMICYALYKHKVL
jgi:hypothetical protein